jgi:ubiquinone/menaquinone biosynthesis C-methylase UbiE
MNTSEPIGAAPKIELGGGRRPRGEGFVNVDYLDAPEVQVRCNFESDPLPFPDDSADEVYTSHTLEHVRAYSHLLHEIARVCRVGARVEIRTPHWLSSMAMCSGHFHTVPPTQIRHWCVDFIADWWAGQKKRLRHLRTEFIPGEAFAVWKELIGWATDQQIMELFPNAAHECRYYFDVITNDV